MSARLRPPAVTMSPFRISNAMPAPTSVNVDSHLIAIFLHLLPVFGHAALRARERVPGHRWLARRQFDHLNTAIDRADVVAESASDTVVLTHLHLRASADRLLLP